MTTPSEVPPHWDATHIPDQTGRLAVITGATGGIGFETALELAKAGGEVILTGRNAIKGSNAVNRIQVQVPGAKVRFEALDLASLASVRAFLERFRAKHQALDLLVNNAGVMALPTRRVTEDGFEQQLGTNFLGHFALTRGLLPLLRRGAAPRIVNLSSIAHKQGRLDFNDPQGERGYKPWRAYSQSKLAMLVFAQELQRRSDAGNWGILSVAAHPGWAQTDLMANGPGADGKRDFLWRLATLAAPFLGHSPAAGALPVLFATTAPEARKGGYYGVSGFQELKGDPAPAWIAPAGKDPRTAARLWDLAEQLTA